MRQLSEIRPIHFVLVLTLVVHVASFFYFLHLASKNPQAKPYPVVNGDSVHYAILSDSLREHGTYADWSDSLTPRVWTPGYPVLLTASKMMTGSFVPAVVFQVVLLLVAVVLIYRMALQFVSPIFATIAACLYGIDPMVVLLNTAVFSDGLFSSLLVIIVYLGFFQSRFRGVSLWAIMGILLGILALIRPIGMYLIPLTLLAFLIRERLNPDWRSKLRAISAFVVCVLVVVGPWMIRNHHAYGVYEISHSGPLNVLHNFARPFLAWRELSRTRPTPAILVMRMTEDPAFEVADTVINARLDSLTPKGGDTWNYQTQVAREIIFGDPVRYAYFHAVNMAPFFLASSVSAYTQYVHQVGDSTNFYAPTLMLLVKTITHVRSANLTEVPGIVVQVLPTILEVVFWALVCMCAIVALRPLNFKKLLMLGLIAYFAILTGPIAMARYRVPVEPFLFILAAVGAQSIVVCIRNNKAFNAVSTRT